MTKKQITINYIDESLREYKCKEYIVKLKTLIVYY